MNDTIKQVVEFGATEAPFTGEYDDLAEEGTYLCRRCGIALYRSQEKFASGCGWPSFDGEIQENVLHKLDKDGRRTEILCARCHAHLGHSFKGEGFTDKNMRHCVNSASLDFVADKEVLDTEEAIVAAGCFWGVEYYLDKLPGVIKTDVGYAGGTLDHPSYEKVCSGSTGHFEVVRIVYRPEILNYTALIKYFFEIHNFQQKNGQGPDIGSQYLSRIFYYDDEQYRQAMAVIELLTAKGFKVGTELLPVSIFWSAEKYHQLYYKKNGKEPYCHTYEKIF